MTLLKTADGEMGERGFNRYYKRFDKLYCVVVKQLEQEGFLITAYPTDKAKEGEVVWKK